MASSSSFSHFCLISSLFMSSDKRVGGLQQQVTLAMGENFCLLALVQIVKKKKMEEKEEEEGEKKKKYGLNCPSMRSR